MQRRCADVAPGARKQRAATGPGGCRDGFRGCLSGFRNRWPRPPRRVGAGVEGSRRCRPGARAACRPDRKILDARPPHGAADRADRPARRAAGRGCAERGTGRPDGAGAGRRSGPGRRPGRSHRRPGGGAGRAGRAGCARRTGDTRDARATARCRAGEKLGTDSGRELAGMARRGDDRPRRSVLRQAVDRLRSADAGRAGGPRGAARHRFVVRRRVGQAPRRGARRRDRDARHRLLRAAGARRRRRGDGLRQPLRRVCALRVPAGRGRLRAARPDRGRGRRAVAAPRPLGRRARPRRRVRRSGADQQRRAAGLAAVRLSRGGDRRLPGGAAAPRVVVARLAVARRRGGLRGAVAGKRAAIPRRRSSRATCWSSSGCSSPSAKASPGSVSSPALSTARSYWR